MLRREDVLGAPTPLSLFGEGVLQSRRELRRRYADLVRFFPPERDPEAFRRIRDGYEALAAIFEDAAAALRTETLAGDQPAGEGWTREPGPRASAAAAEPQRADRTGQASALLEQAAGMLEQGQSLAALRLLDEHELAVRPLLEWTWLQLATEALHASAFDIDRERAEKAFDDLDDPLLEISPDDYWAIASRLLIGQSWQDAHVAGRVDARLLAAVRRTVEAPQEPIVELWARTVASMGAERFIREHDALIREHPGLAPALHQAEEACTGARSFCLLWEDGKLPELLLRPDARELATLRDALHRAAPWLGGRRKATPAVLLMRGAGVAAWLLLAVGVLTRSVPFGVAGFGALLVWSVLFHLTRTPESEAATRAARRELRSAFLAIMRRSGLYRHELVALLTVPLRRRSVPVGTAYTARDRSPLADLEDERGLGLAGCSSAHVARARRKGGLS